MEIDALKTSLGKLGKNISEAAGGTGDAKDAFRAMGIDITDSNGKLKTSEEIIKAVADKFKGMQDGATKTALAMKIFGKSGANMVPLLNQGSAAISALQEEARKMGLQIDTETAKSAEVFNDNMTRLKESAHGLGMGIAKDLLPWLAKTSEEILKAYTASGKLAAVWAALKSIGSAPLGTGLETLDGQLAKAKETLAIYKKMTPNDSYFGHKFAQRDIDKSISNQEAYIATLEKQKEAENNAAEARRMKEEDEAAAADKLTKMVEQRLAKQRAEEEAAKKAIADAENRKKRGEAAILDLEREMSLIGAKTELEKISWEIEQGKYQDLDPKHKARILALTKEIEAGKQAADVIKAETERSDAIHKQIEAMQEQIATIGLTDTQLELHKMTVAGATAEELELAAAYLSTVDALKKTVKLQEEAKQVIEDTRTPWEKHLTAMIKLQELYDSGLIDMDAYTRAIKQQADAMADLSKNGKKNFEDLKNAIEGWGRESSNAIVDFALTGKASFSDMIQSMIADMLKMIMYQNITGPMAQGVSGFLNNVNWGSYLGGNGLSGVSAESLNGVSLFGSGGLFNRGRLIPFARGGVVERPTIFPMAQGMGLMGEAGAEAVVPLSRLPGGDLGIKSAGGGNNVQINVVNNAGADVSTSTKEGNGGLEIEVLIDQAVAKKMGQRGSNSNKMLRQNYSARERLVNR